MGVDLYCGVNETKWNKLPVSPGPLACISPIYGRSATTRTRNAVALPTDTRVMQDSGAFCDPPDDRLSFEEALERQIQHADDYRYSDQVIYMASYDLLIDEVWVEGNRFKRRWSVEEADSAVKETIEAARYLAGRRGGISLVLSAQGVDSFQYLDCVKEIIPLLGDSDVLGLGGWCIVGKMPKMMMPVFRRTIRKVVPYAGENGVKRIHIWGVIYAPALGELLWMCDRYGIALSTDSAGPQLRPCLGVWGYMGWRDRAYSQPPVDIRGEERALHVRKTREWLANLEDTEYYRCPPKIPIQLEMKEMI